MKMFLLISVLFFAGKVFADDQCVKLQEKDFDLLPHTIFNVNHGNLLSGCFAGFLPQGEDTYRFGIFKNGELVNQFPVVLGGGDLVKDKHLKILGVSFSDLDKDKQYDVMVIGSRLGAKGALTFVQVFFGCDDQFIFDDKIDEILVVELWDAPIINVKTVKAVISAKKLGNVCNKQNESQPL